VEVKKEFLIENLSLLSISFYNHDSKPFTRTAKLNLRKNM